MNKEHLKSIEHGLSLACLLVIAQAILGSFSINTRNIIRDRVRAKNKGRLVSELSGASGCELEAAHIDHSRKNPNYDKEFNGILMTVAEHYDDHVTRHGSNGLHPLANIDALELIWERLSHEEKANRLTPSYYANMLLEQKHFDRWRLRDDRLKEKESLQKVV